MKRIYTIIALALSFTLGFTACEQVEEGPQEESAKLEIVKSSLVIPARGGEAKVVVSCTDKFQTSVNKDWLEIRTDKDTVFFTAGENKNISSRYAKASFVCGEEHIDLNIQQKGYLSTSFEPSDITTSADSGSFTLEYDYDQAIEASASVDWITLEISETALTVNVAENTTEATLENPSRTGEISWRLGAEEGTITVTQFNLSFMREDSNWSVSYDGVIDYNGSAAAKISNTVTDPTLSGKYLIYYFSQEEVQQSGLGLGDYIMSASDAIKAELDEAIAYYAQYGYDLKYDDFLYEESDYEIFNPLDAGDYVAVAIGYTTEMVLTGHYAFQDFTVTSSGGGGGETSGYEAWLGEWDVDNAGTTQTWTISEKVKGSSYTIVGLGGRDYPFEAVYNEDGTFKVHCQLNIGTFNSSTHGECPVGLYGIWDDGGTHLATPGESAQPPYYEIFYGTLSGDSATLTGFPKNVNGASTDPYEGAAFIITTPTGGYSTVKKTAFPSTMKRKSSGGGEGGSAYDSYLGTWKATVDGKTYTVTISQKEAGMTYKVNGITHTLDAELEYNSSKKTADVIFQELGTTSTWTYYLAGGDGNTMAFGDNANGVLASFSLNSDGSLALTGNKYTYTFSDGSTRDYNVDEIGLYGWGDPDGTGENSWYYFNNVDYYNPPMTFTKEGGSGGGNQGGGSEAYKKWLGSYKFSIAGKDYDAIVSEKVADKSFTIDMDAYIEDMVFTVDYDSASDKATLSTQELGQWNHPDYGTITDTVYGWVNQSDGSRSAITGTYEICDLTISGSTITFNNGREISLTSGETVTLAGFNLYGVASAGLFRYVEVEEFAAFPLTLTKASTSSVKTAGCVSANGKSDLQMTPSIAHNSYRAVKSYGEFISRDCTPMEAATASESVKTGKIKRIIK